MTRDVLAVVAVQWRLERRAPQVLPAVLLFSVGAFVAFRFGLQQRALAGPLAAGVLLVTVLLAALLAMGRLWAADQEEGGLDAHRLSPASPTALVVGKALALLLTLIALQAVALPLFAVLLLGPVPGAGDWAAAIGVLLLLDVAVALVGALVGALGAQGRSRDLVVPLLAVPLLVPALAAAARALAPALAAGPTVAEGRWSLVLVLYDLVFLALLVAVADSLVDD